MLLLPDKLLFINRLSDANIYILIDYALLANGDWWLLSASWILYLIKINTYYKWKQLKINSHNRSQQKYNTWHKSIIPTQQSFYIDSVSYIPLRFNYITIRCNTGIESHAKQIRGLPTHRNRADICREAQTRKAVEEVYRRHNPRILWRAATVSLLDYGRKENTRLIVREPASPRNTIRSLADRLYDYVIISWQWFRISIGLSSGNFLTSRYNDCTLRLSLLARLRFFAYWSFADQFSDNRLIYRKALLYLTEPFSLNIKSG